jgi:Fe2+ transport system protein FeoA
VERRARGEATEIVQNESNTTVNVVPHANEIRQRLKDMGILQEIAEDIERRGVIDVTPQKAE